MGLRMTSEANDEAAGMVEAASMLELISRPCATTGFRPSVRAELIETVL